MTKWTVKGAPRARGPARPHRPGARYYGGLQDLVHRNAIPTRAAAAEGVEYYVREFNRLNHLKD